MLQILDQKVKVIFFAFCLETVCVQSREIKIDIT